MRSGLTTATSTAGILVAAWLGGCGLIGEGATSAVVAPGRFNHYTCAQLAEAARVASARERELAELIARTSDGAVGQLVGAVSYRTEYMQARGQLKQIAEVSADKNCVTQVRSESDRALW